MLSPLQCIAIYGPDSKVLVLPSERTLRDYRNFFKPQPGFNSDNIERLKDMTNGYRVATRGYQY